MAKFKDMLAVQLLIDFIPVTNAVPGARAVAWVVNRLSCLQNILGLIHSIK